MKIYTVFDDGFLEMAQSFFNSARHHSDVHLHAHLPSSAGKSTKYCRKNGIEYTAIELPKYTPKQVSRILKMKCADLHEEEEPIAYMDIDIVFQGDPSELEDLNPNYLWVLSKREGHQTTLRTWKRHYFAKRTVDFARAVLPQLTDLPVEELLEAPVRNCGVIYGNRSLLKELFHKAQEYYLKMLSLNKKRKMFSDSDQLCFLLAFHTMQDKIRELPLRFNRMPYHQSYDFKDLSCFVVPDTVVLHLNRCKGIGKQVVKQWAGNQFPVIKVEENTRSGIIVPMQNSSVAERALMKNLYSLAVSNKANIYRDEDVGFPIAKKVEELDRIRDGIKKERPAFDRGLFFMINNFMFMIDHGEKVGNRAAWIIGKYVNPHQLAGIFIEQMDEGLNTSSSKIPVIPLAYGTKQPLLWHNQGVYHDLAISGPKKYPVHFIGNFTTNKKRKQEATIMSQIPNSKIEHRGTSKRMDFDAYMRDMAAAYMVWAPPGGRPKTHREIEALCCEIAVVMPKQKIVEQECLQPDVHYICIKDDYSDAKKKVQHYIDHPDKLAEIAYNGRMWYERNASDTARAKYILDNALKVIASL